ncbi:MAG: zinc-ribbon domain-containing protein [Bacilli bacterium]|nr:zinc-ribbon domain-containing protein [Bacilli bacterium]
MKEATQFKPSEVSGGTNKKYWWKCKVCGHEWECVVASRTKRHSDCPICRKQQKSKNTD